MSPVSASLYKRSQWQTPQVNCVFY
uniref:Uncharacterized protein n=1 Tax=Anguilla anguilla TaxID=7936 RepID=A0A0E9XPL2_ANGAN